MQRSMGYCLAIPLRGPREVGQDGKGEVGRVEDLLLGSLRALNQALLLPLSQLFFQLLRDQSGGLGFQEGSVFSSSRLEISFL